jgi:hypothetical protein
MRRGLRLPAVVRGHNHNGPWEEAATTVDVSQGGLSFLLRRPVPMGQVLHMTVPLPEIFRRHDLKAQAYNVYVLVRHATSAGPPFVVGAMYLGKQPPRGYQENPTALVYLPADPHPAADNRKHQRHLLTITMSLRRLEVPSGQLAEELTITEDVSLGGARVRSALGIGKGELVLLTEMDGPFREQALVLNVAHGTDNITRLNLSFANQPRATEAARDLLRRQGVGRPE